MSKKYILNIGHETNNGSAAHTSAAIENAVERFFRVEAHRTVVGYYDDKPEETSVLICTTGATEVESFNMIRILSDELDQDCIAVVFADGVVALGTILGKNPLAYRFDWAQFRI